MTQERPARGRSETSGRRPPERRRESGRTASWSEVDRVLEVRSRLVVIADSIEAGDIRMAEDCVLQLLDDLDVVEFLTAKAA